MINIIIQKIVMDKRPHDNSDDFASTFGMAVGTVFQNFNEMERLKMVEKEAEDMRDQYEQILAERDELQHEVQKLRILPSRLEAETQNQRNIHLKEENDSLRELLKTSKETIAMLQNEGKRGSNESLVLSDDWKVSKRGSGNTVYSKVTKNKIGGKAAN